MTSAAIRRTLPIPGDYPCGLTWDGTHLWHSDQPAGEVYALDPVDGSVVRTLRCPSVRADLAFDGNLLGQVGFRPKRLVLIDRETGAQVERREVPPASGRLTGVEHGPDGIWMVLRNPTVLQLRDYATMAVLVEHPVGGGEPSGLTYADGVVVHGDYVERRLRATDPVTGAELGSLVVDGNPTGMTWDGSLVWYCDFPGKRICALDLNDIVG
ncbi:hypothetical protein [Actinokineospora globicatena]|uniref:hypothetical protein n=1 Tax=Actinokineospora globicatena TaxID=103729 RepID=UPI0020A5BF94|nr:hypothetical protein [Actinokineospora globicatena]MCP2303633.1 hypothetical protein [Actinokineospora globicatena]GLW79230.1 hypothetical protein Aglo01_37120 [Actinokineospora globicatena]GLW86360.1 hypothetical protein Aglo02_39990 [Actinokineospora globicatena]